MGSQLLSIEIKYALNLQILARSFDKIAFCVCRLITIGSELFVIARLFVSVRLYFAYACSILILFSICLALV